ncbi:MAG: flagellar hook protein, partial [Comamonadaceae bacterium]
ALAALIASRTPARVLLGAAMSSVTAAAPNNTLAGVRDAINAAKAGVTASIVNGTGGARLVLRTADGADSSVRLTATDDDGNNADAAGLSALAWDPAGSAGAGANLSQTQEARDALFTIDGVALSSATNSTGTALDGVTLAFKKVTTGPVQVGVTVQTATVRKNVDDFVSAYNALNSMLQAQTKADPTGKNRGPLQADSTAVNLLNGLRSLLRGGVTGVTTPSSLAAAGIALQQDGSIKVDDSKIGALLDPPDRLASLFSQAQSGTDLNSRGFALRFKAFTSALVKDDGVLGSRVAGLKRSADLNSKQQDAMQDRLDRTEARLRAQYQKLDSDMNDLNARMRQMKSALGLA